MPAEAPPPYGTTRSFRPSGIGRYFMAAFMLVWLAGWAVGETVALFGVGGILSAMAGVFTDRLPTFLTDPVSSGAVVFILLFLTVWLTFWTIGGVGAMVHLLRSLWGEDAIALSSEGIELIWRAGPIRRRYARGRVCRGWR
jgi:hypothetical protein